MIKRKWPILVLLASTAGAVVAVACSETGPDAGPRMNGCISADCFDSAVMMTGEGGPGPDPDGGAVDAADGGYPNPIEGTTKAATLVKNGFQFTEGPLWINGSLIFSDTNANKILKLSADELSTSDFRNPSNRANGNAIDSMGRLVTCESANQFHRIVRSAGDGTGAANVKSQFNGAPLNAPNDVIVRADGNIYFTDPSYGAAAFDPDAAAPPTRQPKQAIFRIDPANVLTRIKQVDSNPNGIALSPDGNTLYVVDTTANVANKWTLAPDGTPSAETKFADVTEGDGMAVDDAGNVYISAKTGVEVFDKNAIALGTITVPEQPANCTFGGADRKTLYITARTGLYKIKLNVPGLP